MFSKSQTALVNASSDELKESLPCLRSELFECGDIFSKADGDDGVEDAPPVVIKNLLKTLNINKKLGY